MSTIVQRSFLADFALAKPLYAGARLYVYEADVATGLATTTLATVYRAPTGTDEESNPFTLDGDGKLLRPAYVDGPVVVRVHFADATPTHDTGVIGLTQRFREGWETPATYQVGDIVRDAEAGNNTGYLYICAIAHEASGSFDDDLAAGDWVLYMVGGSGSGGSSGIDLVGTTSVSAGTSKANYIKLVGGDTGEAAEIQVKGGDASPNLKITPDGTGIVHVPRFQAGSYSSTQSPVVQFGGSVLGSITTGLPVFKSSWSVAGTYTGGGTNGLHLHEFISNNSNIHVSGASTYINTYVGSSVVGSLARGDHVALQAQLDQTGATPNIGQYLVSFVAQATANSNAGGIMGTSSGVVMGANIIAQLKSGATYFTTAAGLEVDIAVKDDVLDKIGVLIVPWVGDVKSGSRTDALLAFGRNVSSLVGMDYGMVFQTPLGWWPIKPTGTMIGAPYTENITLPAGPAKQAAWGIDFSTVTFSGGFLKGPGFTVDGSGNATIGSGLANYATISGGATTTGNGDATISTAGSATNAHLKLTTKGSTSLIRGDRPLLFSTSSNLDTLVGLRSTYTSAWFHNNITYAGAMAPRFTVSGGVAGTITGSNFAINSFTIDGDNVNASSAGGLSALYIGHTAGGTALVGNRTAITGKMRLTTASPNQAAFAFITGGSFGGYTNVNPGIGTGFGYDESDGYIFGALLQARAETGARFVKSLQGLELNVGNQESTVPVLDFGGIQVVMENADVGPWMRQANAYGFANQTAWTGQGWGVGYAWVQANGQFGLNRTYGAVLGGVDTQYGTAPETAFGVDFFSLSLTQAHLRGYLNKVVIDGSGNIGGQVVAGTTLQTRSSVVAKTCAVSTITVVDGSLFLTKPTLTVGAPPGGGTQATASINAMAAAYMRALSGGTGYAVNDTITLSGGTSTVAAVFTVKEVSSGRPTRLELTTAGSYTVLPASPISTTTSGSGTGLTLSVWWTALTVDVNTAGDSYPQYPPPPVTAAYTLTGGDRSPLRRMEFAVAMTATQTDLSLNPGGKIIVGTHTPASAAATGSAGMVAWDASYIYVCTASNTWKRAAIATW